MTISGISSSASSYFINLNNAQKSSSSASSTEQTSTKGKPNLAEMFTKLDADNSGRLNETEVQTLTEKISEATGVSVDLSEFMATYDTDGVEGLSEDETAAALEANRPQGPPPGGMGGISGMGGMGGGPDETDMVSSADENGDGVIDADEAESLVEIINNATGSSMTAEEFISDNAEEGSSTLTLEEAVAGMEANRPEGPPSGMANATGAQGPMQGGPDYAQMFSDADTSGDGSLSVDEADSLAGIISGAAGTTMEASDLLTNYDADGDGSLSEEETATALEANRPAGPPPPSGSGDGENAATTAAIENYLKMAALGMENQTSGDLFSMLGRESGSLSNVA